MNSSFFSSFSKPLSTATYSDPEAIYRKWEKTSMVLGCTTLLLGILVQNIKMNTLNIYF